MRKAAPRARVSSDSLGKLPVKLVAPITAWKQRFERNHWLVPVEPEELNGLAKKSAVDALQLRGLDISRFETRLGRVSADVMEEVALAVVVEMP